MRERGMTHTSRYSKAMCLFLLQVSCLIALPRLDSSSGAECLIVGSCYVSDLLIQHSPDAAEILNGGGISFKAPAIYSFSTRSHHCIVLPFLCNKPELLDLQI
ncbi:hypothetical protein F5B22DRAFT_594800 [Xylaria bambusicola]|uniref:uncharacterized protein n=1 Tax=Xylaria bambusicola TaxID=326684 RepID=UPI0020073614|nr:uncharacterized protein F5B22DRAFT_594800 [Xylaria bambusicola]KAI0521944.1 hypothetical protein F5B22DRAFT_594800 [Xylaria bambusicola]